LSIFIQFPMPDGIIVRGIKDGVVEERIIHDQFRQVCSV
jgi:hypothetical protein